MKGATMVRVRRLMVWLGVIAAMLVRRPCVAQPFGVAFTFDESSERWANQSPLDAQSASEWNAGCGRTGGGIHLSATGGDRDQMRPWRKVIHEPPVGKRVRASAWVKGRGVENVASLVLQAHGSDAGFNLTTSASTQTSTPLSGDFEWTRIETTLDIAAGVKNLQILLLLVGNGEVWFDDVEAREDGDATVIAPGLFEARGKVRLTTQADADAVRLMPIPLSYREQVPLSYTLLVDPPERLRSAKVLEHTPGNWVVQLTVAHPEEGTGNPPVTVEWSAIVLVGGSDFSRVPATAAYPERWPDEATAWLASTLCVQAGDERIQRVAKELRGESGDVMEVIRATLARAKVVYDQQSGSCTSLDAVQALEKRGSCTSRANLVAALLRASGIPARVLAGYPAWSGALQTHYIVEAWVPGYGWYPIEPTKLGAPWPAHEQIAVSIIPPAHEEKAAARPQIAGGVPYLSLDERDDASAPFFAIGIVDDARPFCDHVARPVRNFPVGAPGAEWTSAMGTARVKWAQWLSTAPRVNRGEVLRCGPPRADLERASLDALPALLR